VDAEPFTTLVPTFFIGQGFGFMPESMRLLKPFAVTAQLGYAIPTKSSVNQADEETGLLFAAPVPRAFNWGGTLQYSMPYVKSSVQDFGLPAFINRMIPIVEWNLSTEVSNFSGEERTTGTINPGAIYVADKFQLAVEAIIPVNRASGDNGGVHGTITPLSR
jgi:hypothetical protein